MEIIFKNNAAKIHPVDIEPSEFDRLKKDFLSYLKGTGEKGGVYKCTLSSRPKEIVLRFEEIICIVNDSNSQP